MPYKHTVSGKVEEPVPSERSLKRGFSGAHEPMCESIHPQFNNMPIPGNTIEYHSIQCKYIQCSMQNNAYHTNKKIQTWSLYNGNRHAG